MSGASRQIPRPVLFPEGLAGVIFDCDGVMLDSRAANAVFYNKVLDCLGLAPMTPEQEAYSFMATAMQALRRMVPPRLHDRIEPVVRHEVVYERDILPLLRLRPGFRECLDALRARGLRLAVHTNRTRAGIQSVLDIFCLAHYFDPVVAADTVAPKPSPDGVLLICRQWRCAPRRVLFVGDSEHDASSARGAGAVFAAMGDGALRGRITCNSFTGLLAELAASLPPLPGGAAPAAAGPEDA